MTNFIQKLLLYLYSKKKNNFEIIKTSNILKNSSNVLILLPEEKELLQETKFLISILNKLFKQKTFLMSLDLQKDLNQNGEIPIITYSKEQKNFLQLPKKHFIKFLQLKNFDTVIDCNLKDSNFHYWITKDIKAKFKIGLYRKNSTLFNNLVMKVNKIENTRKIYENFLYLLKL